MYAGRKLISKILQSSFTTYQNAMSTKGKFWLHEHFYLTSFGHLSLNRFREKTSPRSMLKNVARSFVPPALRCSGYPISLLSLLRCSRLSMFVVISIRVSLENPRMQSTGLKKKTGFEIQTTFSVKVLPMHYIKIVDDCLNDAINLNPLAPHPRISAHLNDLQLYIWFTDRSACAFQYSIL